MAGRSVAAGPIPGMFGPLMVAKGGDSMDLVKTAPMSVRELIVELSEVEEALRRCRRPGPAGEPIQPDQVDVADLVRREQAIVRELRRRARAGQVGWRPGRARRPL